MKTATIIMFSIVLIMVSIPQGNGELSPSTNDNENIPDFRTMTVQEMEKVVNRILKKNKRLITGLIQQLREEQLSNEGKVYAVYLLGNLRAYAAVDRLIANIDLKASSVDPKTRIGRWGPYPAQGALVKIGKPASSAVLESLSKEKDALRRKLMCAVLVDVEGKEISQIRIRKKLKTEPYPEKQSLLKSALKLISDRM
jgi:hypothetical protein